eukprot:6717889-Pyramimonas_sp.AAC.1
MSRVLTQLPRCPRSRTDDGAEAAAGVLAPPAPSPPRVGALAATPSHTKTQAPSAAAPTPAPSTPPGAKTHGGA